MEQDQITPLRTFVVDRTIDNTASFIWLAATNADEVKYETVGLVTMEQSQRPGNSYFAFKGKVPRTSDYLYGIRMTVPIEGMRVWIEGSTKLDISIRKELINLKGTDRKIKGVCFDPPIPLFDYHEIHFDYGFNSGDEISLDFNLTTIYNDAKVLNPCLTLSIVQDQSRLAAINSKMNRSTQIKIILPDNSTIIYDSFHLPM